MPEFNRLYIGLAMYGLGVGIQPDLPLDLGNIIRALFIVVGAGGIASGLCYKEGD